MIHVEEKNDKHYESIPAVTLFQGKNFNLNNPFVMKRRSSDEIISYFDHQS